MEIDFLINLYILFEGNNKSIRKIYINRPEEEVGLFKQINSKENNITIRNLEISGEMTGSTVGGITGSAIISGSKNTGICIDNCISNVNINAKEHAGGIIGDYKPSTNITAIISNCTNKGNITGENAIGGIIGFNYYYSTVINCCNMGNISDGNSSGGIVGYSADPCNGSIINSYNWGNVQGNTNVGGIIGYSGWVEKNIKNCYNIGSISGNTIGGIIGGLNTSNELLITEKCYYLNTNISKGIGGWDSNKESQEDIKGVSELEMKSNEILNNLKNFVIENDTFNNIKLKNWKVGENGYPIFE